MKLASLVGASIRQDLLSQMERIEHFQTNWIWYNSWIYSIIWSWHSGWVRLPMFAWERGSDNQTCTRCCHTHPLSKPNLISASTNRALKRQEFCSFYRIHVPKTLRFVNKFDPVPRLLHSKTCRVKDDADFFHMMLGKLIAFPQARLAGGEYAPWKSKKLLKGACDL